MASAYSAFQIIDGNSPLQPVAAEMWLTSLEDALGTTDAWIFYYAKTTSGLLYSIHRAKTGLPPRQTATTLSVTPQGFQSDAMQLQLRGLSGQYGVLQRSDDLGAWTDLNTFLFGIDTVPYSDAGAVGLPRRFYRLRTP